MVRELLSFARPSAPVGQVVALQGLMDSVLKLASIHPSSGNVTIDLACQVWRPKVNASEEQLKQVFYNLVRNGLDAMPNGGTLTIQVGQRSGFVCVEISDTGQGIPCELRDRVFEPFYTTKAPQRGTGLGLSISRRIVNQHSGASGYPMLRAGASKSPWNSPPVPMPVS